MVKVRYPVTAFLVCAIFIVRPSFAGEISLGAKFGLCTSNITQTPKEWEDDKSYRAGFTGGVFLNYALSERFSIQPELLYTQRGVVSNLYDGIVLVDLTASFDYFELPVLAIYSIPVKESFTPFVYAGPCFSATLSSELEVSALLFSAGIDFSSLTHVTDFGIVAGAGFDLLLNDRKIVVDARFQRGFTNVILSGDFEIDGSTQTISEDDFKNYGFSLTAGYVF
jgi:hypothetical protein